VFGHYEIRGQLGAGGMGVVYSAYDTLLQRNVAIKVVGDRVLADKPARDLLLHEARAASALNHPNICTIHQVGDSDGQAYIVMEQVEGQPLSSHLAARSLPPELVIQYGVQIADALAHAHKHGVIHRDLKSTNAVVSPEGRVKVLDFGLATRLRDAELQEAVTAKVPLTESRMIVGTLPYLAPELLGGESASAQTDIWALGVLLYEMASGRHPFHGRTAFELSSTILRDPPTPLPATVPSGLAAVILRCLEKLPGDRYPQACEIRDDLRTLERDGDAVPPRAAARPVPDSGLNDRIRARRFRIAAWTASMVAALVCAFFIFRWLSPLPQPRVEKTTQLTHYAHASGVGGITSDGARIFFRARDAGHWNLMQVPVAGGEAQPFPSPFPDTIIMDVSPDRSEFLVVSGYTTGPGEYWTLPVVGGSPRRLSNLTGFAAFSPDGQKIAYHNSDGIYICSRTGSDAHRLVSLPSQSWGVAWSPDGKTLRFTVEGPEADTDTRSLWEVSADGSNLRPLLPGWHQTPHECCGQWSADGRYYVFLSNQGDGAAADFSVWARREMGTFAHWFKPAAPVRLTAGPINFGALAASKDSQRFLAIGRVDDQIELLRSTPDRKQFFPMIKLAEVYGANIAPRGDKLALVLRGWTLWRSRTDGSERIQLAADFPGGIDEPRWSPDGTRIVFQGRRQEGRSWNIYQVSAEGGATQELLPNDRVHEFPDWLADGKSVVYSTPPAGKEAGAENSGIFVLDLKTQKTTRIPGSDNLIHPRTTFGGRYLAALSQDQKRVMLFDFQTRAWKEIAHDGKLFYFLEATPDGKYLYFQDLLETGEPLYRVHAGDWKLDRVMSFESLLESGLARCRFMGLTADGSPMVLATRVSGDIYALDLDLP
jgi:dipeptidyl aminopeptidase/acylaminoacyl peptidase